MQEQKSRSPFFAGLRLRFVLLYLFGMVVICTAVDSVHAANWLMLQGVERPGAEVLNFNGFLMADFQDSGGGRLDAGPFKGQTMAKGLVGPGLDSRSEFNIRKFQFGVRGALGDDWNYSLRGVTGNNIATRGQHDNGVMLVEASLTWSVAPGIRIRAGMFKTPGSEESLAFAPPGNYINLTGATNMLIQERFFRADGTSPEHANNYSTCSCCRDSGIMLFDALRLDSWEFTYALMLGRGYGLGYSDPNSNPDLYLYAAAERLFGAGRGRWRQGWKVFAWSQHGQRTLRVGFMQKKHDASRKRYGIGTTFLSERWRLNAEFIRAKGMIFTGSDAGAVPGAVSNDGNLVSSYNVLVDERAYGWYVDGGYEFIPGLWGCLRYDEVRYATRSVAEQELCTLTLGLQYYINPKLQIKANYAFRTGSARRQPSDSVTNQNMENIPDNWGVQLVWAF